jgi:NADH-quinone oxidoreductase subunit L
LFVLAAGALFMGYVGFSKFVGHDAAKFWGEALVVLPQHTALEAAHHAPSWVALSPLVVAVSGIALAYVFYMLLPDLPARIAARFQGIHRFLLNKWYFDELYDFLFVRPAFYLGRGLWRTGDGTLIDGVGPDGDRLPLSLRLRHADRRGRADHLVSVPAHGMMTP